MSENTTVSSPLPTSKLTITFSPTPEYEITTFSSPIPEAEGTSLRPPIPEEEVFVSAEPPFPGVEVTTLNPPVPEVEGTTQWPPTPEVEGTTQWPPTPEAELTDLTTSPPVPEGEGEGTSATVAELLLPPIICLACICIGLVIWLLIVRRKLRKSRPQFNHSQTSNHHGDSCSDIKSKGLSFDNVSENRSSSGSAILYRDSQHGEDMSLQFACVRQLFDKGDFDIIERLQGQGPINVRELMNILLPVIFSLGFCPLTLLLHGPITRCLWPSNQHTSVPDINEAIACFLAPAGMVYAVSFGFVLQQVTEAFRDTEIAVQKQAGQLKQLLMQLGHLTGVSSETRVAMIRIVKDITLTSASTMLKLKGQGRRETMEELDDLLRLLYSARAAQGAAGGEAEELWQTSVFQRLERLITHDEVLSPYISRQGVHALQWAFLETLGYFSFLGMLLVQCESYRAELALCLLTVISITLLCYIVADLDSPFHGVFRVDLAAFCRLVHHVVHHFNAAVADVRRHEACSSPFSDGGPAPDSARK